MRSDGLFGFRLIYNNTYIKEFKPPFKHLRTCKDKCTGGGGVHCKAVTERGGQRIIAAFLEARSEPVEEIRNA